VPIQKLELGPAWRIVMMTIQLKISAATSFETVA